MRPLAVIAVGCWLLAGFVCGSGCRKAAPPKPPDYSGSNEVNLALAKVNREYGLRQARFEKGDGATLPAAIDGINCQAGIPGAWKEGYIYFIIDPSFKAADCRNVQVTVHYFDAARGWFEVQYDGPDPSAPGNGAYTRCPTKVTLKGTRTWELEKFRLTDARLENSQNGNADFRLHFQAREFFVSWVTVTRE